MLLSSDQFTKFAADRVVLSWENVREPVNLIHEGERRTLGGNTVMYIVSPDGFVVDAFPGVYLPSDVIPSFKAAADASALRPDQLKSYHGQRTSVAIAARVNGSKAFIESSVLDATGVGDRFEIQTDAGVIDLSHVASDREKTRERLGIPPNLSDQEAMALAVQLDSKANMTTLRPKVHEFLSGGVWTPDEIKTVMFKDFLGVKLDEPNLGIR